MTATEASDNVTIVAPWMNHGTIDQAASSTSHEIALTLPVMAQAPVVSQPPVEVAYSAQVVPEVVPAAVAPVEQWQPPNLTPTAVPTPVGDSDGDGVLDDVDNCPNVWNKGQRDSNGDGIADACTPGYIPGQNCQHDGTEGGTGGHEDGECSGDDQGGGGGGQHGGTDTDNDGIPDAEDNCATVANPGQKDTDGDGDACLPGHIPGSGDDGGHDDGGAGGGSGGSGNVPDNDGDGFANNVDNCPEVANPGQKDTDGNGIGDACESDSGHTDDGGHEDGDHGGGSDGSGNVPDNDGDGFANNVDNCPEVANLGQKDTDGNGIGDACEGDTGHTDDGGHEDGGSGGSGNVPDNDGDAFANNADNCPEVANPGQEDTDGNGIGDACEGATEHEDDGHEGGASGQGGENSSTGGGDEGISSTSMASGNEPAPVIELQFGPVQGEPETGESVLAESIPGPAAAEPVVDESVNDAAAAPTGGNQTGATLSEAPISGPTQEADEPAG